MNRILRIHGSRDHCQDQPVKAVFSALTGGTGHPHCSRWLNPQTCGFSLKSERVWVSLFWD